MNIVIITGGQSGLGFALTQKLLDAGYFVCDLSRSKKQNIKNKNYKLFLGDISNEEFVKQSVEEIYKIGNVSALINNADVGKFALPTENTKEIVEPSFKCLQGMIYLCSNVLKHMEKTGGKIINIMSTAALKGNKGESVYCANKWGWRGFTESLKTTYKGTNVKVMGVYPGGMNTDFWAKNRSYVSVEKSNTFMTADDVANIIVENAFTKNNVSIADLVIERN